MYYDKTYLQFCVGGLLYTPAINDKIAEKILQNSIECLTSIAFCLEDAIADDALEMAENTLIETFKALSVKEKSTLPLLFIRIRNPEHMTAIFHKLGIFSEILTGFILPKFDCSNSEDYINRICEINIDKHIYIMPIIETESVAHIETRIDTLIQLKKQLDGISQYVLNIRVGGNDFSNIFGLRREANQSIYQMSPIANILNDVFNIFGRSYVVSAPVWEYFENNKSDDWRMGLKNELSLDKLNGFIGKTAIHPSQLPLIRDSLMVSLSDYDDAKSILSWDNDLLSVAKSIGSERMNEVKVHGNWAKKILMLSEIYGIKN